MRRGLRTFAVAIVTLMILMACGTSDDTPDTRHHPSPSPPPASPVPTLSQERIELKQQHAALQTSYDAIALVWEGLATGQQIQCAPPPDIPAPESITQRNEVQLALLSELLRTAAGELRRAAILWQAECANPRPVIPPDVIDRGRLATRAAGDALRQADELLREPGD